MTSTNIANSAAMDPSIDRDSSSGPHRSTINRLFYGGFTRFELELEVSNSLFVISDLLCHNLTVFPQFVQSLANPYYLNYLASQKLLQDSNFVEYLKYLQYFTRPEHARYLSYPGPTLKALELLQQEKFRQDILSPDLVARLAEETLLSSVKS